MEYKCEAFNIGYRSHFEHFVSELPPRVYPRPRLSPLLRRRPLAAARLYARPRQVGAALASAHHLQHRYDR